MASKLRRPPLLVYDPAQFNYVTSSSQKQQAPQQQHHHQQQRLSAHSRLHNQSKIPMECGLTSTPAAAYINSAAAAKNSINGTSSSSTVVSSQNKSSGGGGGKGELHVNFQPESKDLQDRRKYLTAKYGPHQMNLIRKRLAVESWLYDQLIYIFDDKDCDVELDLDELLDIDDGRAKRIWVQEKLIHAKRSSDELHKFIEELLVKAATL